MYDYDCVSSRKTDTVIVESENFLFNHASTSTTTVSNDIAYLSPNTLSWQDGIYITKNYLKTSKSGVDMSCLASRASPTKNEHKMCTNLKS